MKKLIFSNFWPLMIMIIVLELYADYLLKKWSANNRAQFIVFGVGIYSLCIYLWAHTLKLTSLIVSYNVYLILSSIGVVILGSVFFGESVTHTKLLGIVLGLTSVYFLSR